MKTNRFFFSVAILSLALTSCKKDDPDPEPTPSNQTCIELSGNQQDPLTLTNHNSDPSVPDYCISGQYTIFNDVIVEPGVTIQMNNGAGIYVNGAGSFKCVGTAASKIKIRGVSTGVKGQWGAIRFSTSDTDNQLIYTDVTGGGDNSTYNGMVVIMYDGYALIDNCYVGFSSTNGIKLETQASTLGGLSNTDVSFNDLYPISLNSRHLGNLENTITGTGNLYDKIDVESSQINFPMTWKSSIFPYKVNGTLGIIDVVVVQPGTKIHMGSGANIQVGNGGALNCMGTASSKIIFTGDTQVQGSWGYIRFSGSSNTLNRFEHCEISYGGGDSQYTGMITLWVSPAYVRIGNSIIKESLRYGVFNLGNNSTFVDDGNNTWSNNTLGDLGN